LTDDDRALPESSAKPARFLFGYPENEKALLRRPRSIGANAFPLENPKTSSPNFAP